MALQAIDWVSIIGFFAVALLIGIAVSRRAGTSSSEFFLSGRNMPWWLLGFSMVATTFSTDTPNLVTDIVRQHGVAGNWVWLAFLLTGMGTVFVYAKLWRRSESKTDVEFYELRYSGKSAAFLRGFRAIYLGVFFNIMIMASVTLAAIKIGGVMFNFSPVKTIIVAAVITTVFSTMGGLRGVLLTDFLLFIVAMGGSIVAAVFAVRHPAVGGLSGLVHHPGLAGKLSILPDFSDMDTLVPLFLIPLAVQWWSVWYPGAEPGGGGYIVQRMLAAKDERNATGATLFFNIAHYALRPWPWILVALASLIVFPDLAMIRERFPNIDPSIVRNDLAYPAMLTFLPAGLLGLVTASLIAAYMSTISTHLNWGSSYVVYDFYKRFVKPDATEKELVRVGRISTVVMMAAASVIALALGNALRAFNILLQIGAGTGLLFVLRWFWWRINAMSELSAMIASFAVAVYFEVIYKPASGNVPLADWQRLLIGVGITTAVWIVVTFVTRPVDDQTLKQFVEKIRPGGPGWKRIEQQLPPPSADQPKWEVPYALWCMAVGCAVVYSALFATGYWIYGRYTPAMILTAVSAAAAIVLMRAWRKLDMK